MDSLTTGKPYFSRATSGLVKEMSLTDAFLVNVWMGTPVYAYFVPLYLGVMPGAQPILAVLLAVVLMVALAVVYAALTSSMPRSGGEYVFLSRVIHPAVGFAANFAQVAWTVFWVTFSSIACTNMLGNLIGDFVSPTLGATLVNMTDSSLTYVLATIVMILAFLLVLLGIKAYTRFQLVAGILATVGCLLIAGFFMATDFKTQFDAYAAQYGTSYQGIIDEATSSGAYTPYPGVNVWNTLALMVTVVLIMMPYVNSYMAGEMKAAANFRRQLVGMVLGGVCVSAFLSAAQILAYVNAAGFDFAASLSALSGTPKYPLPIPPYFYLFLAALGANRAVVFIVDIAFLALVFLLVAINLLLISRCVFAWGMDLVFPKVFANVDRRFHSPYVPIIATLVVANILTAASLLAGVNLYNYVAGSMLSIGVFYLVVAIGGAAFPFVKKAKYVYETSPARLKLGPIPVILVAGIVSAILSALIIAVFFFAPGYAGTFGLQTPYSLSFFIAIWVCSPIYFYIRRAYLNTKGIPIDAAFRELPPV